jgi:hypothetical protein
MPRQKAHALIAINLAGARGRWPLSIAGSIQPSNHRPARELTVVNAAAGAIARMKKWPTSVAQEWLPEDSVYEGTDISGPRQEGPRIAAHGLAIPLKVVR